MNTQSVGIREFRDNLASYLLASKGPVAITRHGDTIGYYLPVRRRPTAAQLRAFREANERLQMEMAAKGITEDDILEEFKRLRAEERRKRHGK